jgi:hypothetical protein
MCCRDLEKILRQLETEILSYQNSHPYLCNSVSPYHLNYNNYPPIKADLDEMQIKESQAVSSSDIESQDSCLGLVEDLEDEETKQHQMRLTKVPSFNRREYNAFIGRLGLHML